MVTAIISTYNDIKQLPSIISALQESKYVTEIIVVDDGSTNENKQKLKELEGVELILNDVNKGKSAVMKQGFLRSTGEIILFVDADLDNFSTHYIESLIEPVRKGGFDMTIALRGGGRSEKIVNNLHLHFAKAISGERALRSSWIKNNMDIFKSRGFSIESEINKRHLGKLKVAFVDLPRLKHEMKFSKYGLQGITSDLAMAKEIIRNIGIKEFVHQSKTISKIPVLKLSEES